jgi:hypothetical protein
MKRLLLVLAASAALSAWGQAGREAPKAVAGGGANSNQPTTVVVLGFDGQTHEFQVPTNLNQVQIQKLVQDKMTDLEHAFNTQGGCPVQIVDASFERPVQLMLTSQTNFVTGPTLRLNYRNFSGKDIETVVFTGWIKVKDSPYQLDSVTHPFQLELSPEAMRGDGGKEFHLASTAIGFDRIELAQVNYVDGTTWQPKHRSCVYSNMGVTERAKAW